MQSRARTCRVQTHVHGPLWKRIDYGLVKNAAVVDFQRFNHAPETGNVKDCLVSDHAGIVVRLQ